MSTSEWMPVGPGDEDYVEINFLPGEACPKQIRVFARQSPAFAIMDTEVRLEIVRNEPVDGSDER